MASSRNGRGKAGAERGEQIAQIAAEVGKTSLEPEVEHDVDQGVAQPLLQRIVAAVGRRVGIDVLGGDGRPHEDEAVVEIAAAQRLDRYRVEERFRALRLLVVDQEADVVQFHVLPQRVAARSVEPGEPELALDPLGGLLHAAVVEVDPVARDVLDREPVARLEMPLRRPRAFAEERVMLVEAFEQRNGDRRRLLQQPACRGQREQRR